MKYMGSKARIAKYILPIMLNDRKPGQWWVEPFVGGGNVIDKVTGNRLGADIDPHAIEALKFIRDHPERVPKNNSEYNEEMYNDAKKRGGLDPLDCFARFSYAFGGVFRAGWRRDPGGRRDYVREAADNAVRQSKNLQGVDLVCASYERLDIPDNSIVYCDIPYKGKEGYKSAGAFDHSAFFQWCREKVREGHTVFVSEYDAPNDFHPVWEREIKCSLAKYGSKITAEKLFLCVP